VPYQWVISALANGFYLDSDACIRTKRHAEADRHRSQYLHGRGRSHNTLSSRPTDLVAFEAPIDEAVPMGHQRQQLKNILA